MCRDARKINEQSNVFFLKRALRIILSDVGVGVGVGYRPGGVKHTHTHPEVAEVSSSKALKPCKLRVSGYVRACLALCLPQKM